MLKMKGQTAMEYIYLLVAAIFFVALVIVLVRGGIIGTQSQQINNSASILHSYISNITSTT